MPDEGPVGAPAESAYYALPVGARAGALPHSLAWFATRPDSFYRFTRSRAWVGWARERCVDRACASPLRAFVSVEAIEDAQNVNFDDISNGPIIVGRLVNRGKFPDARYTACPATKNPTDYWSECYIVVGRTIHVSGSDTTADQQLAVLSFDASGAPKLDTVPLSDPYAACPKSPDHPVRRAAHADFTGCGHLDSRMSVNSSRRYEGEGAPASALFVSPLQDATNIACAEGCCSS